MRCGTVARLRQHASRQSNNRTAEADREASHLCPIIAGTTPHQISPIIYHPRRIVRFPTFPYNPNWYEVSRRGRDCLCLPLRHGVHAEFAKAVGEWQQVSPAKEI